MSTLALILPSYNRPELALRAIHTALRQRAFHEIVVVDDGSDRPADFSAINDRRLKIIRHGLNRGVSAARNTGIAATRASHLMFLDDDDRLMPFASLLMAHWLRSVPQSERDNRIVVGGVLVEKPVRRPLLKRLRRPPSSVAGEIWGLDTHLIADGQSFATKQAAVIPRTLFDQVGGWDESLRSRETSELFFRLTEVAPVEAHAWPVYRLNRGGHEKLTADPARRKISAAYIREKHAGLLSDPARCAAFEQNHEKMMARTM